MTWSKCHDSEINTSTNWITRASYLLCNLLRRTYCDNLEINFIEETKDRVMIFNSWTCACECAHAIMGLYTHVVTMLSKRLSYFVTE